MKLVAIDIGNTKIKLGVFSTKNIDPLFTDYNTFDDFKNNIVNSSIPISASCHFAISSVVPQNTQLMVKTLKNIYGVNTFIVKHNNCGVKLNVERPETVGADRLCNIASAIELYNQPSIIIDFGTANTYDVINKENVFIGGAISPGIETSAQYLINKAALLDETKFIFPNHVIGKNTETNIQSGIMFGAIDQINGMINRIQKETEVYDYSIILTGGFGKLLSPQLSIDHILDEHLTLKGLSHIYNLNV